MRGRIEEVADHLLDGLAGRTSFDLIEEFAMPFPITVIAESSMWISNSARIS